MAGTRMLKSIRLLGAVLAAGVIFAGPAAAQSIGGIDNLPAGGPQGTVTPNPVPVQPTDTVVPVTVSWTGFAGGDDIFVVQCGTAYIQGVSTSYTQSCITESVVSVPGGTATGAGTTPFNVVHGQAPGRSWGCYAQGEAVPAGVTGYTDCFVRVLARSVVSPSAAATVSLTNILYTYVVPPAAIPEVPLPLLVPLGAVAAAVGGVAVGRRRRLAAV